MQRLLNLSMLSLAWSIFVPLHTAMATPLELAYPIAPTDATDFITARGEYITQGCSTLSTEFPLEERIGSGESGGVSILTEC
jgi:hypothetical protein